MSGAESWKSTRICMDPTGVTNCVCSGFTRPGRPGDKTWVSSGSTKVSRNSPDKTFMTPHVLALVRWSVR